MAKSRDYYSINGKRVEAPTQTNSPRSRAPSIIRGFIPLDRPQFNQAVGGDVDFSGTIPTIYACSAARRFSITGPRNETLAGPPDFGASVFCVRRGEVLVTQRPGKSAHRQEVSRDGVMVDLVLAGHSSLGSIVKRLQGDGQRLGLRLDLRPMRGVWRSRTGGASVFEPGETRIGDQLQLSADADNGSTLTVIE